MLTSTTCSTLAAASALTRSAGTIAVPNSGWSRPTSFTVTPSGSSVSNLKVSSDRNGWNNGRSWRSGLNRQSSSRPVGTAKSAGSREVNRSRAGDPVAGAHGFACDVGVGDSS